MRIHPDPEETILRRRLEVPYEVAVQLSDAGEAGLRALEEHVDCDVFLRGNQLTLDGEAEAVQRAATVVRELTTLAEGGHRLEAGTIPAVGSALSAAQRPAEVLGDVVWQQRDSRIVPKTALQKRYVDAIRRNTVTFGIGPAGTGKTFLAVAMAANALARHEVKRIILTRPAVEAGERLGFLPGDLMQKVDPYLRPLFDALHDMLDPERVTAYLENGVIEVAPLAFMRGRTLNDAFIILDEAQNTTPEQMKMFLTRLGYRSRMVITGDVTQVDLPKEQRSGLMVVGDILDGLEDVEFVRFGRSDVVRNKLVQRIVDAYDEHDERQAPELRPAERREPRRRGA
jgi:phosphate starvation-inducible PhoH-like protein